MSTSIDVVKRAYKAWEAKDESSLISLLHEQVQIELPGGRVVHGHDGARQMLEDVPEGVRSENELYVEDGNNIVRIWDCIFTEPKEARVRMAELNVLEDGKIIKNECFFDPSSFPMDSQGTA